MEIPMRFIPFSALLLTCTLSELLSLPPSQEPHTKVNYPSHFQVEQGLDLTVIGDYLYWRADEQGLRYAHTFYPDNKSKINRVQPCYTRGFRTGLGLHMPQHGMDLTCLWTHFESHTQDVTQGAVRSLWAQPTLLTPVAIGAEWHLGFNVADFEWGRASWVGGNLSWRPFAGLRALVLEQALCSQSIYATDTPTTTEFHAYSFFSGGGVRAGSDARFTLPWGFSLYSTASGALLYGKSNAKVKSHLNSTLMARTQDKPFITTAALQLLLGLGWDTHWAKDRLHIELHAGWEGNLWLNINQMNHFQNFDTGLFHKESSALSTQGLTVGGTLCF